MRDEVIKYSAAGFRDFTRLAGSDPIMWRDVYNKNKDAVLEMLGRFSEDLSTYQKAIRNGDLEFLENKFNQSKKIEKKLKILVKQEVLIQQRKKINLIIYWLLTQ